MVDLFRRAGALRGAYGAVDWSASSLGSADGWSPALRAAVDLSLNTDFAMALFWGPDFAMIYNEAYAPLIGDKHPAALGAPARDVFPEIWDDIGPLMQAVRDGDGPVSMTDTRLLLNRHGYLEECFFSFCYSAAGADTVEGVVDIAVETTQQTVARRRLELLTVLGQLLTADLRTAQDVLELALPVLRNADLDLLAVGVRRSGLSSDGTGDGLPGGPPPAGDDDVIVEADAAGHVAWVRLSTAAELPEVPVLGVRLSDNLDFDDDYRDFLRLIAVVIAQSLDRIAVRVAEQKTLAAERGLSEAMQRSLLTEPLQPEHLHVAVRYQPAAEQTRIGGDWYDSFLLPDGSLTLAVGDVSGHDRQAAAAMAQVRNLLRGVAYTGGPSPAAVLTGLDRAMQGLGVGTYATAVVARVEQAELDAVHGNRVLRWSNAGHPPPVLISPTGQASLLEAEADLMLGVMPGVTRADHAALLEPGSSVVFYSDGLIERRHEDISISLDALVAGLHGAQNHSAERICDDLLARFGHTAEDDIVLLVLHTDDRDEPRPTGATPDVRHGTVTWGSNRVSAPRSIATRRGDPGPGRPNPLGGRAGRS